jgi:hypothetical protein
MLQRQSEPLRGSAAKFIPTPDLERWPPSDTDYRPEICFIGNKDGTHTTKTA